MRWLRRLLGLYIPDEQPTTTATTDRVSLEEQLARLEELGLRLDAGITLDDLLYSFDREDYESRPYDLLLIMLGAEVEREPWGRAFSSRAWGFDTECVEGSGAYVEIVERLARLAGMSDRVGDLRDEIDLAGGSSWLEYTVDGRTRRWDVEVNDDWVDPMVLSYVMDDLETGDRRFWALDNGQAMVVFSIDATSAASLQDLTGGALRPLVPTDAELDEGR